MASAGVELVDATAYHGVPFEVRVTRPGGISSSDWVGLYVSGQRDSYHWVRPRMFLSGGDKVKFVFGKDRLVRDSVDVVLKYYSEGGYFSNGTLEAETRVAVLNPLREMHVLAVDGNQVTVRCELRARLPGSGVKLMCGNLRLASAQGDGALQQTLSLALPRVAGTYDVAFFGSAETACVLSRKTFEVPATERNRFSLSLSTGASPTGALAVPPQTRIAAQCGGPIRAGDEVIFVPCAKSGLTAPPVGLLQAPKASANIDPSNGQASISANLQTGLYYVVLAVREPTGCRLCGAFGLCLVTNKAGNVPQAPVHADPVPAAPPQEPATPLSPTFATDQYQCVICCDHHVDMLIQPCNHLVTCEACCSQLVGRGDPCPLCRGPLTNVTKVFLP
eukprot:TRINITY_DN1386_c0_g1_i2.p1 TRINITY_DN1386_c0_g1~~TRINITY_DN1386_c0_g1_i2.p1  ORF type:complete len:391 (+),score=36.25 TRINITY_DN1386_c0_g1_i2:158-1330(+)